MELISFQAIFAEKSVDLFLEMLRCWGVCWMFFLKLNRDDHFFE